MKRSDIAVAEIVGTLLLLVITLTLFSGLYATFISIKPAPIKPSVNLVVSLDNNNITLDHGGGNMINLNAEIIVSINGSDTRFFVKDYLNDDAKKDGEWGIGEQIIYPTGDVTDLSVSVSIVDPISNSVIMIVNLQE